MFIGEIYLGEVGRYVMTLLVKDLVNPIISRNRHVCLLEISSGTQGRLTRRDIWIRNAFRFNFTYIEESYLYSCKDNPIIF